MAGAKLTPELLLRAYSHGLFPMAEARHDPTIFWLDPDRRAVLPLNDFHVPRRLARTVRQDRYRVTIDTDFEAVIRRCAAAAATRTETWINDEIIALYGALHAQGHAHSVECWQDGQLAGGLYGVSIRAAFFGESMFSRARDASKVALVHLVGRLLAGGYDLLDAQFITGHLTQFGAREVSRRDYRGRLAAALQRPADFYSLEAGSGGSTVLQAITQTS